MNAPIGHASDGRLEGTLDGLKLGAVEGCLDNVDVKVGLGDVEGTCDGTCTSHRYGYFFRSKIPAFLDKGGTKM